MFHYQDKVRIVSGFYEGYEGVLTDSYVSYTTMGAVDGEPDTEVISYNVELSKNKTVSVTEENLELISDE